MDVFCPVGGGVRGVLVPVMIALLPLTAPAMAQVQAQPLTLDAAIELARRSSPSAAAAGAGVDAAAAGRRVAWLRPNPTLAVDVENVGGSRAFNIVEAPKQTVSLVWPLEPRGRRLARIGVADARGERAAIDRAIVDAALRLAVTQAYTDALASDRRLATAREQARIASEGLRAARARVQTGRASPLEESRAAVARTNADVAVGRAERLATAVRATLALVIGGAATGPLDSGWFDRIGGSGRLPGPDTLTLAAARADVATAGHRNGWPDRSAFPTSPSAPGSAGCRWSVRQRRCWAFRCPFPCSTAVPRCSRRRGRNGFARRLSPGRPGWKRRRR